MTAGAARAPAMARGQGAARAPKRRAIVAWRAPQQQQLWRAPQQQLRRAQMQQPWRAVAVPAVVASFGQGCPHSAWSVPARARRAHTDAVGDEVVCVMERLGLPFVPSRWNDIIACKEKARVPFAEDGSGAISIVLSRRIRSTPSGASECFSSLPFCICICVCIRSSLRAFDLWSERRFAAGVCADALARYRDGQQ